MVLFSFFSDMPSALSLHSVGSLQLRTQMFFIVLGFFFFCLKLTESFDLPETAHQFPYFFSPASSGPLWYKYKILNICLSPQLAVLSYLWGYSFQCGGGVRQLKKAATKASLHPRRRHSLSSLCRPHYVWITGHIHCLCLS